jgi:hypothetical protein
MLNSLNCLTPNPPYSLRKQIFFQEIQGIFLKSSHPPEKINQKRFNIGDSTCGSFEFSILEDACFTYTYPFF